MAVLALSRPQISAGGIMAARDFVLPVIVAALFFFISPLWASYAVVFGGQAHFLMAYIYQYRAKKMMRFWYLFSALLLAVLSLLYFTVFPGDLAFLPIFLVASNLFGLHYAIDELTLHGEQGDMRRWLSIGGFFSVFFLGTIFVVLPHIAILPWVALGTATLMLVVRVLFGGAPSASERYLWFVTALILSLALFFPTFLDPYSIIGLVVWLHFFNWMIGYGIRVHGKGGKEIRYWLETVATFGISFGLFLVYLYASFEPLGIIYSFAAYNAWAIAHIVLSFVAGGPAKAT